MGLARSTYYYKPKTDPKLKAQQDLDLRDRIEEIQSEFSGYGYRRVQQELKRRGETINTKRVRRVMKLHQLRPLMWGRQVQVTAAQQQFRPYPNRIKYQRVTGFKSSLGRRHHLHPDPPQLYLPGRDPGCVFPQGGRLGVVRSDRPSALPGRFTHGDSRSARPTRLHSSFRSGSAISVVGLSRHTEDISIQDQYVG